MGAQQEELLLRTPVVRRTPQSIDSMISQIDSDARERREGEKKKSVNSFGKRFDHPPPSLVDEIQHSNKRRRVSLDVSPTSLLAFDDVSFGSPELSTSSRSSSPKVRLPTMDSPIHLGIRLRPRNLGKEFGCDSYSLPTTRDIPFMPF